MPEIGSKAELEFSRSLSKQKKVVFVITRHTESLDTVLGVYTNPDKVIDVLLEHGGSKYTVIRASDLESLEIDGDAIIATKVIEPELRVSRCTIDPHIGPIVYS